MHSLLHLNHRSFGLVAAAAAILALTPIQAAITLTIDANAKTFSWGGSATSEPFVIGDSSFESIRLGNGTWNGGYISDSGENSLIASTDFGSGWSVDFSESSFIGQLIVAGFANTIVTELGFILNSFPESGSRTGTISVSGDGVANSYADYSQDSVQFLESLQGVNLYFQNNRGGAGVTNIGGAAGSIVVIPEPAGALVAAMGSLAFFPRRR